jgi:exopolyphosphatase / guanosine-5'-triphosphate,3'-diphosphate pyrophosphatase
LKFDFCILYFAFNTNNYYPLTYFTIFTFKSIIIMRIAIIDMGTNTCNLLIVESNGNNNFKTLHNSKYAVKLGEGGINLKYITPEAWRRGIEAIKNHMATIATFDVDKVLAFATSATRDAENGALFVDEIYQKYQLSVNVIEGEKEALLIYHGVRQAVDLGNATSLILDIGGGSNELILCNSSQIFWMHSFNLGVQRLLNQFKPNDPITFDEIMKVEYFLEIELKPLMNATAAYPPVQLIGSSGSFDTYRSVLANAGIIPLSMHCSAEIPIEGYLQLHQNLLKSTRADRLAMKGMEPIRVDFIVLASIFTNFIVKRIGITSIHQSNYALKEGALWEILNKS